MLDIFMDCVVATLRRWSEGAGMPCTGVPCTGLLCGGVLCTGTLCCCVGVHLPAVRTEIRTSFPFPVPICGGKWQHGGRGFIRPT